MVMAGFRDLADTLAELDGIPSRIAGAVADGINEEIRHQFEAGQGPYGDEWAELLPSTVKRKGGDRRILRRTDALSSETIAQPTQGAGIEITSLDYGGVHQVGDGSRMVARPILPDDGELPLAWEEVIERESTAAFRRVLR